MQERSSQVATANQTYASYCEKINQGLNQFAHQRGLPDQINAFLVTEMEANQFDPSPYYAHMILDGVDLGKGIVAARYPAVDMVNLSIGHTYIDYDHAKKEHKNKVALENERKKVSANFIETIKLYKYMNPPKNYNEALAHLKTILSIQHIHFLDPAHYEEYKNYCELLKLEADRFAQHQLTTKLDHVELELKNIMQQQDQSMRSMAELKQLQNNNIEIINRVEQNMPQKKEIEHLETVLKELGIGVNDKLKILINQSEYTRKDIGKILQFLENEYQEKLLRAQRELKAANYQGLSDACHFVSELGKITGSRELSTVAGIANASVQIHRAVDQIMTAGISGMALMGPYAAIGMAVLSVFSMFRRSADPNRAIMKQLMRISKQISALHKDMSQHFQHLDERLTLIFQKMMEGFESLQMSNHINISSKLAEIQSQLETLTRITKVGFEENLLKDLYRQVDVNIEIRQDSSNNSIPELEYKDRLRDLKRFILSTTCSPLLNGTVYSHLLNASPANTSQLVELLKQPSFRQLENLMGLLAYHAKTDLKIPEFQRINEKIIFQPRLWQIALETYLEFKKFYSDKYKYDTENVNLSNFRDQLQNYLNFIYLLQSTNTLYKRLLIDITSYQMHLQKLFDSMINNHALPSPCRKKIIAEPPAALLKHSDTVKKTKEFFSEENLPNILKNAEIIIPKEFLEAEKLGLGYLEFQMHFPENLHENSRKNHRYRFKKAAMAGLEVSFYLGGQKIVLYSKSEIKDCKIDSLSGMYTHIIKACKNKSPHLTESCKLISQAIRQDDVNRKIQSAQRLASCLIDDPAYHQLLKLNHLLLAYLTCTGLPTQYIQRLSNKLFLGDLIGQLEKYARNPSVGELPKLQCCPTETLIQEFDVIQNKLNELRPALLLAPEVLNLQEMLQRLPAGSTSIGNSLPNNIGAPIYSSLFQNASLINGATKAVKLPQNGHKPPTPKH